MPSSRNLYRKAGRQEPQEQVPAFNKVTKVQECDATEDHLCYESRYPENIGTGQKNSLALLIVHGGKHIQKLFSQLFFIIGKR